MTRWPPTAAVVPFLLAATLVLLPDFGTATPLQASAVEENRRAYPPDSSQHPIPAAVCSTDDTTELELSGVSRSLRHNGNDGEARFVLRSRQSRQTVLWSSVYVGEGVCLGFNPNTRRFLIGIVKEHGIGARLTQIVYLDAATRKVATSAFDKSGIEAFAAVPGPGGRFVALIGIKENDTALYVLDTEKDAIRKLGKAPLPPPLNQQERDTVKQHPEFKEGTWGWLSSFRDGYVQLDARIVVFRDAERLQVSYGDDTAYSRDGHRTVTIFDLAPDRSGRH